MFISVLIATYDRSTQLRECLVSLSRMNGRNDIDHEIVVVNNNPGNRMNDRVVEELRDCFGGRLRYCIESRPGAGAAHNRGIREARGEILAFIDDDVTVEPQWLAALHDVFVRHKPDVVQGKIVLDMPRNCPAHLPRWFLEKRFAYVNHGSRIRKLNASYIVGANFAARRSLIEKAGMFDPRFSRYLCGDTELCQRFLRHDARIFYTPFALVNHHITPGRLTARSFLRQSFRWGQARIFLDPQGLSRPRYAAWLVREGISFLARSAARYASRDRTEGFLLLNKFFARAGTFHHLCAQPPRSAQGQVGQ